MRLYNRDFGSKLHRYVVTYENEEGDTATFSVIAVTPSEATAQVISCIDTHHLHLASGPYILSVITSKEKTNFNIDNYGNHTQKRKDFSGS